jgi:hypothetical protein
MRPRSVFVTVAALASMAGCAMPSRDQANIQPVGVSQRDEAYVEVMGRCNAAFGDARINPIRSKVVIGRNEPSFDMLANQATATDDERPAIRALAEGYISCQRRFTEFDRQYLTATHASLRQIREDSRLRLLAQLYNRQISYGQYNQADANLRRQYQAAWAQLDQALAREQAAQAQSLLNQRANQPAPPNPGLEFGRGMLKGLCESQGGTFDPAGGCRQPRPIHCTTQSMDATGGLWDTTCR